MLAMQAGDRTVAMQSLLIAGDGLFCFKIAYDESLGRYSPGTQLMAETAGRVPSPEGAGVGRLLLEAQERADRAPLAGTDGN